LRQCRLLKQHQVGKFREWQLTDFGETTLKRAIKTCAQYNGLTLSVQTEPHTMKKIPIQVNYLRLLTLKVNKTFAGSNRKKKLSSAQLRLTMRDEWPIKVGSHRLRCIALTHGTVLHRNSTHSNASVVNEPLSLSTLYVTYLLT